MPNDLMPDTSSYADPAGNALLAKGYDGNAAMQGTIATMQGAQGLEMNKQVMALRNAQIGQEQLALGRSKLTALNGVLGGLVTNPTADNATSQIGWAAQNGVIDPQSATKAAGEIAALGGDPQKIKAWATDHLNQNAQHQQLMDQAYGTPGTINTGGATVPTISKTGANAGITVGGGAPIANTPTPEFNSAPRTWQTSDGVTHQGTQQQYQDAVGAGATGGQSGGTFADIAAGRAPAPAGQTAPPARSPAAPATGAAPVPAQGGAPAAMWTPTAQTMPTVTQAQADAAAARVQAKQGTPADRNIMRAYVMQNSATQAQPTTAKGMTFEPQPGQPPQAAGQGGAPAVPAPNPGGGTMPPGRQPPSPQSAGLAGPAPGLAQAQGVDADASAKQFASITAAATNLPNMKATIANMESVLPQITTGPQAAAWNHVKSGVNFATQLATGKDAFDPHTIAAQDEFHNNAVKLAQQQFQQLGGTGTDGQLASASGDVPNESLSNMSNSQLLAMSKGLIDAQQARTSAAEAWKQQHGPASYGAFVDDWNRSFSPRAFQYNYLSPADRGTMLKSMQPQEKAQLKTAYDTAVQRGWIAPQTGR